MMYESDVRGVEGRAEGKDCGISYHIRVMHANTVLCKVYNRMKKCITS